GPGEKGAEVTAHVAREAVAVAVRVDPVAVAVVEPHERHVLDAVREGDDRVHQQEVAPSRDGRIQEQEQVEGHVREQERRFRDIDATRPEEGERLLQDDEEDHEDDRDAERTRPPELDSRRSQVPAERLAEHRVLEEPQQRGRENGEVESEEGRAVLAAHRFAVVPLVEGHEAVMLPGDVVVGPDRLEEPEDDERRPAPQSQAEPDHGRSDEEERTRADQQRRPPPPLVGVEIRARDAGEEVRAVHGDVEEPSQQEGREPDGVQVDEQVPRERREEKAGHVAPRTDDPACRHRASPGEPDAAIPYHTRGGGSTREDGFRPHTLTRRPRRAAAPRTGPARPRDARGPTEGPAPRAPGAPRVAGAARPPPGNGLRVPPPGAARRRRAGCGRPPGACAVARPRRAPARTSGATSVDDRSTSAAVRSSPTPPAVSTRTVPPTGAPGGDGDGCAAGSTGSGCPTARPRRRAAGGA